MRGWYCSSCVAFSIVLFTLISGCSEDDSGDDDSDAEAAASDDDVLDEDDDADDDAGDDDLTDDDAEPYRGWMRPCDIDGEPGGEFAVVESYPDDTNAPYRLHVVRPDGTEVGSFDVEHRNSTYTYIDVDLANLDNDAQCEIVVRVAYQDIVANTYENRVRVFDGANFEVAFDTGLESERIAYLETGIDVNGGGLDLILYGFPTWSGSSTIDVYDGHAGYEELWHQTGSWDNAFLLMGRRHETGAAIEACETTEGPAFALLRYPMYQGEAGDWRAMWIDPEGSTISTVGPIAVDAAEKIDADLMPTTGADECALMVASVDAGETISRYRLFDPSGDLLHEEALDVGGTWYGRADGDLDGDGEADIALRTTDYDATKGVWAALSSENYAAARPIVTSAGEETIEPALWRTKPWLQSGVDLGGGEPNFYVGPFIEANLFGGKVTWKSVGPDLSLTGLDLTVHMGAAVDFGGDALAYWARDGRPVIALNAWSVYYTAAKGPVPIEHGRWAQFDAGQTSAFWLSDEPTSNFTIGPIFDLNGDGGAEILQRYGEQPLTVFEVNDGMSEAWVGGERDDAIIGEWY
ncbi:MAG: hypothetical protein IT350_05615 [Deltaproteobacteria bacterium]|nr:hypothetical protein [Deltaproteobacteria bacterium]